jgi:uncharacterized protein (DUF3084 family)
MSERAKSSGSDREMARLQARSNLLLALYSHAAHDLERTRVEADTLRNELAEVRRDFEMAHRQLGEARDEVERVHRELGETRNERDRLAERAAQLQQQLAAVIASTSWRITAPIRAVTRATKR